MAIGQAQQAHAADRLIEYLIPRKSLLVTMRTDNLL